MVNKKPGKAAQHVSTADVKPWVVDDNTFLVGAVRWVLLFFAFTLPLYYDLMVPEVSGDVRWMATSFFAGLAAVLLLVDRIRRGRAYVALRWPVMMWLGLGLAIWALVSLVDALNWMRGIILIKAMYAQMTLAVCVYMVATPVFMRRLMWALVIPMTFCSFLGIVQFMGWNQQSFDAAVNSSWFVVLKPLFWVCGSILHTIFSSILGVPGWPNSSELITQMTGFFQQSAIPGGTFANKNLAGSWTAMMLPMALYLLVTARKWYGQALGSFLLAIGGLFLVYARARASWVALFASLLTMAALFILIPAWRKAILRHLDWGHLVWLAVPVIVVGLWGKAISPVQGAYAVDRTPSEQVAALANSSWGEIGGRLAYNLNSMVITGNYWFNGVGIGSFYVIYPPYYNAVVVTPQNSYSVMARPQRTHTDMMQAFDEMGIPGGIMYMGVFISAIAMAFRLGGRRAGAVGGKLVGAGMATMVLAVMLFVEAQGMLALPSPWNGIVEMMFIIAVLGLLGWGLVDVVKVQKEKTPADDLQLLGLMAGIGVLTISINALMDFPMQLPTAPAAAAMLMGTVAAIYKHYYPETGAGPQMRFKLGRPTLALALVVVGAVWIVFLVDAWKFRTGNLYLKAAMVRIYSGIVDDETLRLINQAYEEYPLDPRIHEHMGVVYAGYTGNQISLQESIEKLEWVVKGDKWGANHLVNLCGKYLQLAQQLAAEGDGPGTKKALDRLEELYGRLQQAADFSHFTWGIGGMLKMLEGKNEEAASLFQRALAIEPGYAPAVSGLQLATQRAHLKPLTVKDAITNGR